MRNKAHGSIVVGSTLSDLVNFNNPLYDYGVQSSPFAANPRGQTFAEMATEVPTLRNGGIRNGGKTYVIKLKTGMRWSDGIEITSADFAFGWKVAYEPAGGPNCLPNCVIERVDTPDRYTAVYHLSRVDHAFLLADLPAPWPVRWPGAWNGDPNEAVLKLSEPTFGWGPTYPSDGPYQIVSPIGKSADAADLRPMRYYDIMNCGAQIQNLRYEYFSRAADELAALEAGKLDFAEISDLFAGNTAFQQVHGPYRLHVDPTGTIESIEFNLDSSYAGQTNPLRDTRVREALALALDKRALIANAQGLTNRQVSNVIQWSFCVNSPRYRSPCADPSITGQWDPLGRRYDPNPGRGVALLHARELLNETPWARGFTLDVACRSDTLVRRAEQTSMADSWGRLGVKLKLNYYPTSALFGTYDQDGVLARGRFQAALVGWPVGSGVDSFAQDNFLSSSIARRVNTHDPYQENYSGIDDPVIDRAVTGAARTLDEKVRARDLDRAQEELTKRAYWDVLYSRAYNYLEDGRIANLSDNVENDNFTALVFWNTWDWKVKSGNRYRVKVIRS